MRRLGAWMILSSLLPLGMGLRAASAAILYVDNRASCPGTGATGTPYCSIQHAFNAVVAGDSIRIRTGTGVYDQSASVTNRSGTADRPILLEPDAGASFIIRDSGNGAHRSAILIKDSDHWIVRNLVFDDTGINPSIWGALKFEAATRHTTGNKVLNNTFRNTGGSQQFAEHHSHEGALVLGGCVPALGCGGGGYRTTQMLVQGNTFRGVRFKAIRAMYTQGVTITQNTITGMRCGRETDTAANEVGMHLTYNNLDMQITHNTLRDFEPASACTLPQQGYATTAGIWCDVGGGPSSQRVTIAHNTIANIDQGKTTFRNTRGRDQTSTGLFIEEGCAGYHVHHNVVEGIGTYALRNQYHRLDRAQAPNLYEYNTFANIGMHGAYFTEGVAIFRHNIVRQSGQSQVNIPNSRLATVTFTENLYDDGGGQRAIGAYNGTTHPLGAWQQQCRCDAGSLATDPQRAPQGTTWGAGAPPPNGPPPPPPAPPPTPRPPIIPPQAPACNLNLAWEYPQLLHPQTQYELRTVTLVQGRPSALDRPVVPLPVEHCPLALTPDGWQAVCTCVCLAEGDYSLTVRARRDGQTSPYSNVFDLDFTPQTTCAPPVTIPMVPPPPPAKEEGPKPGDVAGPVVGGAVVVGGAAAASGAGSLSIPGLVNPGCVSWRIEAPCVCGWPPKPCTRVTYFEPRWIAEIVKKPGTSALPVLGTLLHAAFSATGVPALGGGGAGNASGSGHTNLHYSEVRIWSFPQVLGSPCTGCMPVNAMPVLHYASEIDAVSWRTSTATPLPPPALLPVGVWGNVYPRTGNVIHGSPPIAAALAAVRAMDIVRQPIGMPPHLDAHIVTAPAPAFPTCIQMASPRRSPCVPPGVPPPVLETGAVSPNGSYIFLFWTKRDCCVEPAMATCGATLLSGHGAKCAPLAPQHPRKETLSMLPTERHEWEQLKRRYAYALDWFETDFTSLDEYRRLVSHMETLVEEMRQESVAVYIPPHSSPFPWRRRLGWLAWNLWVYGRWTTCHHPSFLPHNLDLWQCILCGAVDIERKA